MGHGDGTRPWDEAMVQGHGTRPWDKMGQGYDKGLWYKAIEQGYGTSWDKAIVQGNGTGLWTWLLDKAMGQGYGTSLWDMAMGVTVCWSNTDCASGRLVFSAVDRFAVKVKRFTAVDLTNVPTRKQ